VNLNYFDLNNLSKQQTSAGEDPGFAFGVLNTGRVKWDEHRAQIQFGELYPLYSGQNITTSRQRIICAVLARLGNFHLNSTMVPDGDYWNFATLDSAIRCQPV
jgi:hypothetical protein